MGLPQSRILAMSLLVLTALAGTRGDSGKDGPADPHAGLIRQLGDDSFARREAASRSLVDVGEKALPSLRDAAAIGVNLEVRRRARDVINAILRAVRISKSTGLETVVIEAGSFQMGSPNAESGRRDDEALHPVGITSTFLLGVFEVTQEEYQKVMKSNPSWFAKTGAGGGNVVGMETARFPVENVTWFDAIEFCNRLSKQDGHEPYYKITTAKSEGGAADVTIVGGNGFRLPTEAEWEFACRAKSTTPFHFGLRNTGTQANLKSGAGGGYGGPPTWKSLQRTTTVGAYAPNSLGLYDMHGNVEEWCWDWYDRTYYARSPNNNPPGPVNGTQRVARGGSWLVTEASCRSASRSGRAPAERTYYCGFRVARTPH